ncbi:MAG TPA: ammonia-forming cytochrome c nitrite reductase subunit c552 [Symbiobacteriaceae bacterium]|nr:ammonia-forming cytochrome c nitrite reductase subunit c552 [Symbiobacteriaceae bacterium]
MKKALKIASLVVAAVSILVAGSMFLNQESADAKLPEYVGAQACLGCHSDFYERWVGSPHAHMIDEVIHNSDLPADPNTAPAELQAELAKATFVVAGQRFLARDPVSGELKYLSVQFDKAANKYVAYKGGSSWDQGCAGCHSTGWDMAAKTWANPGIGCEACHGPGREHILGKGDPEKITASANAAVCGQCHNGSGKVASGTTWPVGYRPNMKDLSEVGFTYPTVDPHGAVPEYGKPKMRQYSMWQASAHATSLTTLKSNDHWGPQCLKCHTADAYNAIKHDNELPADHNYQDGITCVTCHSAHSTKVSGASPRALCESCHTAEIEPGQTVKAGSTVHHPMKEMLAGYGAIGVPETKGAHSEESCVECHMTEGNHMFKVIKPSDVIGTARKDTCSTCHTNSTPESREVYLNLWQENVSVKLETIAALRAEIEAAVKANPNAMSTDVKAKFDAAKTNASFVEADASKGAHNFEYAIKVLTAAQKDMEAVAKLVK